MRFSFCIRYQTIPNYIIMDYSYFLKFIVLFHNYILLLVEKIVKLYIDKRLLCLFLQFFKVIDTWMF